MFVSIHKSLIEDKKYKMFKFITRESAATSRKLKTPSTLNGKKCSPNWKACQVKEVGWQWQSYTFFRARLPLSPRGWIASWWSTQTPQQQTNYASHQGNNPNSNEQDFLAFAKKIVHITSCYKTEKRFSWHFFTRFVVQAFERPFVNSTKKQKIRDWILSRALWVPKIAIRPAANLMNCWNNHNNNKKKFSLERSHSVSFTVVKLAQHTIILEFN